MYVIKITVINTLGTFEGNLEFNEDASYEDAKVVVDRLEENVNNVDRMVIVAEDGTDIAFTEGALVGAVLKFKIEEIAC